MYIRVKVKPGAKEESIKEVSRNQFAVETRQDAERNMANADAIRLVAKHFLVPINKVRIVTGHHARSKIMAVELANGEKV